MNKIPLQYKKQISFSQIKEFLITTSIFIESKPLYYALVLSQIINTKGIKTWLHKNEKVESQVLHYIKRCISRSQNFEEMELYLVYLNTLFNQNHLEANTYRQSLLLSILDNYQNGLDLDVYCVIRHLSSFQEIKYQLKKSHVPQHKILIDEIHELENIEYSIEEDNDYINHLQPYQLKEGFNLLNKVSQLFSYFDFSS